MDAEQGIDLALAVVIRPYSGAKSHFTHFLLVDESCRERFVAALPNSVATKDARAVIAAIRDCRQPAVPNIIVDLINVLWVNSLGLKQLARHWSKIAGKIYGTVVYANVSPLVANLVTKEKLDRNFQSVGSLVEAVAYFSHGDKSSGT